MNKLGTCAILMVMATACSKADDAHGTTEATATGAAATRSGTDASGSPTGTANAAGTPGDVRTGAEIGRAHV